jgi:hypothetical protein
LSRVTPDKLWFIDLQDIIQEKISAGHQVIVAGDFNDDLNDAKGKTRLFMERLGLREIMLESFGKGPATYIRGTKTIDGVFATHKIQLANSYYLPFDRSPSDHRWIILDIDEDLLLGTARDDIAPPLLRKATSKIPSVKETFQTLVNQQVQRYQLRTRIEQLYNGIVDGIPFTEREAKIYESIEGRMQRAIKCADSRCRKARRGKVPFSPLQRKLMGAILVLRQIKLRQLL